MKRLKGGLAAIAALAALGTGTALLAQSWGTMVAENEHGHVIGNPDAENKLVEFMSYTCSHCATFANSGEGVIKVALVPRGNFSFEIRHLLRDPIDLTAALLTHCGDTEDFPMNHSAIMARYDDWVATARATTQAQRSRWQFGTHAARRQAIASDLGFYEIMENRGYPRPVLDRCLADDAKAQAMAEQSAADVEKYGLQGTPSFVLDGKLLEGVHGWSTLEPVLRERDKATN